MNRTRFSPQRQTILDILQAKRCHLSAEDVLFEARKSMPRISLGTVYRNLKLLEEQKQISQVQGLGQSYFEAFHDPHHHFICRSCGSIEDIEAPDVAACVACINSKSTKKIENVVSTLYGLCETCYN